MKKIKTRFSLSLSLSLFQSSAFFLLLFLLSLLLPCISLMSRKSVSFCKKKTQNLKSHKQLLCAAIYLLPDGEKNRNFIFLSLLLFYSLQTFLLRLLRFVSMCFGILLLLMLFVSSLWLETFFHILHLHNNAHVFSFDSDKHFTFHSVAALENSTLLQKLSKIAQCCVLCE